MESGGHAGRKRLHRDPPLPLIIQSPRSGLAMAHALRCFIHLPRWIATRTSVAGKQSLKFISLLSGFLFGSPFRLLRVPRKKAPLELRLTPCPEKVSDWHLANSPPNYTFSLRTCNSSPANTTSSGKTAKPISTRFENYFLNSKSSQERSSFCRRCSRVALA